jgi:hypothetical protein
VVEPLGMPCRATRVQSVLSSSISISALGAASEGVVLESVSVDG